MKVAESERSANDESRLPYLVHWVSENMTESRGTWSSVPASATCRIIGTCPCIANLSAGSYTLRSNVCLTNNVV